MVIHGYSKLLQYVDILVKKVKSNYYQYWAVNLKENLFLNKNSKSNYTKIQLVCIHI